MTYPYRVDTTTSSPRPVAVITGASSGIGEQFARRYAREGFDLVLVSRSESELRRIGDDLSTQYGVDVDVMAVDLSRAPDLSLVTDLLLTGLPRLDHLVNCAGMASEGDLADADDVTIRRMIDLNITALTLLTRAAVIRMRAAGSGTIVNVASAAAYQPIPHLAAYSASKSFVLMLTEALSEENREFGLRIMAVSPGDTETPMNPGAARGKRAPEQVVETAWRALPGRAPSVIDGRRNSILAAVSTRLLPARTRLRIAERMMRDKA